MTDDIVTRLRQAEWNENPNTNVGLCAEAADEIECLRADRDRWFKIADELYSWSVNILGDHMTTPGVQAYEQAARGE